jgi:hypothetical protein
MSTTRVYRCTLTTLDGQPVFTVLLTCERGPAAHPTPLAPASPGAPTPAIETGGDAPMTEPQKRYLFRLLAQQGLNGPAAEAHLKHTLGVAALREVSKTEASQLIDQLVAAQTEGTHVDA